MANITIPELKSTEFSSNELSNLDLSNIVGGATITHTVYRRNGSIKSQTVTETD